MQLQIHNLKRLSGNLKVKIENCQLIQKKIINMNKRLSHHGIERLNKVAFRQVQIKHTSQFTIHLGCEFYVQMKTDDVIQYLDRKKKKYLSDLKKVQVQLQILQKQNQNYKTHETITQQINQKFSSTMEVIGKNQIGEDIFNIVQVEGEQEDIAKWEQKKQQVTKIQTKQIIKNQSKKEKSQIINQLNLTPITSIIQSQQIKQDSDQNMEDEKISDSDNDDDNQDYQANQENKEDDLFHFNRLRLQDELSLNFKQDPQMKNIKKNIEKIEKQTIEKVEKSAVQQKPIQQKQINPIPSVIKKQQPKKIVQQPPKKISKFKMQRMKERE